MDGVLSVIITCLMACAAAAVTSAAAEKNGSGKSPGTKGFFSQISSDGHAVPSSQDLTCETQYGHRHGKAGNERYIVHEEPQTGYVVLNGVMRKISDCREL